MNERGSSPLTYRSMHLLILVLFCLGAAHVAQAHILPLMAGLADTLSFVP